MVYRAKSTIGSLRKAQSRTREYMDSVEGISGDFDDYKENMESLKETSDKTSDIGAVLNYIEMDKINRQIEQENYDRYKKGYDAVLSTTGGEGVFPSFKDYYMRGVSRATIDGTDFTFDDLSALSMDKNKLSLTIKAFNRIYGGEDGE